jgi:TonB-linked SusC/RagA family outer membrane protein
MKKLTLLIGLLVISVSSLLAQTKVITGTISSSIAGEGAIPGVTVQVKGTTIATATDANGKYSLTVPQDATTLLFTYIGMKPLEVQISGRTVIDGKMESDILGLQEIVVTSGYGIRRAPKSSSALNQVVSGDKLNEVRQTNVNNALAGKVSGIQFRGQSAAKLGSTGEIRLRGANGFSSSGGGVLYVVDGTVLPNSGDLNMDDIEDISVLSGPSASAILGSQGANGAIIITTKKAKVSGGKAMGVELNSGFVASHVYILPNYQNDYAGGGDYNLTKYTYRPGIDPVEWQPLDGKYYHDYSDDASWGPRMAGQEYIPWYAWYGGTKYSYKTATLDPQPNNARDFYDTGTTWNNSVAFSKVSEGFNIRASVGNVSVKGLVPTTYLNKTNFSVKTTYDITKKLTFGANVNFYTTFTNGEFDDGYSNQTTGSFNQWFHRDLNMDIMKELKDLKTPDGIWASWNHNNPTVYNPANTKNFYAGNYWFNFYKYFDLNSQNSRNDRLFGDISLSYKIIDGLSIKATYRRQQNNSWGEVRYSTDLLDSSTQATGNAPEYKGTYRTSNSYSTRENFEGLISYSKTFGDFKVNANAGNDFFRYIYKYNYETTNGGFNIKNLYTISNSKDLPGITNDRLEEKYNALFVRGDLGYKDFLFAEFTLRNDWFSTLPADKNSVLSKSFGGSFVFGDLLKLPFMDFGKVRASWGEVPRKIDIYAYPGFAYGVGQYQWNGNFMMSTPDQLVDPAIHGAVNTQFEVGLELRFLKNKVGFIATYWDGTEKDIPYSVSVAAYSGFTTKLINTGKISKKGIDLAFNFKVVDKPKVSWDLGLSYSYLLDNTVVKIADGIDRFSVSSPGWSTPNMVHATGYTWGQIYGNGIKRDSVGNPYVNANGSYANDPNVYFGSVLPRYTGGVQNSVKIFKNIIITANLDYQVGGKFFSLSDMWGSYSGLTAKTSGLNDKGIPIRDPVGDGGGVHVTGVDNTAGANFGKPVDYYVECATYFHGLNNNLTYDPFIYDLSYLKLRELSIGYNVPIAKIGLTKYIQSATVTIVAQNPWMIWNKTNNDFDPSEISRSGDEQGQFPGVRSLGANIKIIF